MVRHRMHIEPDVVEFGDFARAVLPELHRFGQVLTGNPHDGADLAQSVLERVGVHWTSLRRRSLDPVHYTRRAMVNAQISAWRRSRREYLVARPPDIVTVQPQDTFEGEQVRKALRDLPSRQRTVLVLRYYGDLPMRDIARMLGISVGTVKSQSSKALRKLRNSMTVHCPNDPVAVRVRAPLR